APLSAPDQWQGRAVHPVGIARVGLCLHLSKLTAPSPGHEFLVTPLQLASTSPGHRTRHTHLQTQPGWIQRLDTSQLAVYAVRGGKQKAPACITPGPRAGA